MRAYRTLNRRGARQRTRLWLLVGLVAVLGGCGSLTSIESTSEECPPGGCFGDASVDAKGSSPDAITPPPDSPTLSNEFCGLGCDPDDENSCANEEYDAAADAASQSDAGTSAADGSTPDDASGEADTGGGNMGGKFGPSSSPTEQEAGAGAAFACQVGWPTQAAKSECRAAGPGKMNDACSRSSDCAAGLTCVGTLSIGRCLKYCCLGNVACPLMSPENPLGLFCSDEISRDYLVDHPTADPSELRKVPVCVAGRGCDPVDPTNDPKRCEAGTSCAVVRSLDGTTGCVALPDNAAGEGGSCKDVPCAEGFVCAKATNVCMKLCHTSASNECTSGVCQGGTTNLPAGFGVCVGSYDK